MGVAESPVEGSKISSLRLDYNIAFRLQIALETAEPFTENRGMLPDAVDRWLLQDEAMVRKGRRKGDLLINREKNEVYSVKIPAQGVRDLRDRILALAGYLAEHGSVSKGYLFIASLRSTPRRTLREWKLAKEVLLEPIRARMRLVGVVEGQVVADPDEPPLRELGETFRTLLPPDLRGPRPVSSTAADFSWAVTDNTNDGGSLRTWKHLEVQKVLLHRWLTGAGPITMTELTRQVGCNFRTASAALRAMGRRGLIARTRSRSVELRRFTSEDWQELFALQRSVYPSAEFVDVTGRANAAEGLLRRLARQVLQGVAVGGVIAGRRWDPQFDLNGTPRLDLVLHAPGGGGRRRTNLEFVRRLDPALKPNAAAGSPVLVVHPLYRADPLFHRDPAEPLPVADPVETIFQLNEMGLTAQADALLGRLRASPSSSTR